MNLKKVLQLLVSGVIPGFIVAAALGNHFAATTVQRGLPWFCAFMFVFGLIGCVCAGLLRAAHGAGLYTMRLTEKDQERIAEYDTEPRAFWRIVTVAEIGLLLVCGWPGLASIWALTSAFFIVGNKIIVDSLRTGIPATALVS